MKRDKSVIGVGLLTAIASSLCCITPLLAILAGTTGLATTFQWVEPLRPYLIGITVAALGFAWYQQLIPIAEENCGCEVPKPYFFQGKSFLGVVTVFAAMMLTFPLYSKALFSSHNEHPILVIDKSHLQSVEFEVIGMTCGGCEAHVEHAVSNLKGVTEVKASYEKENTTVAFDSTQTTIDKIEEAIKSTNYKVGQSRIIQ